ncbi:hypothetical protein [Roseivivax marinus]|uniref:hypothetical protein n=1 Tax=Roseivivax marinus TaxID=1379903 RepID=UPI00273F99C5|nr:hypothetical protein [Roseivivax marinus]
MILKTESIPVEDTENLRNYFEDPGENEYADWIQGCPAQFDFMALIAESYRKVDSVRHLIVSPSELLSDEQWDRVLDVVVQEFRVPDDIRRRMCIVEHAKARADGLPGAGRHRHHGFGAVDATTAKVLKMSSYFSNEYVARCLELEFGHDPTPGRFSNYALRRIREERGDLDPAPLVEAIRIAAEMEGADPENYQARGSYREGTHRHFERVLKTRMEREAKRRARQLIDGGMAPEEARAVAAEDRQVAQRNLLPGLCQRIREIAASCEDMGALPGMLEDAGYSIRVSETDAPVIDWEMPECRHSGDPARTMPLGALDRLARVDRAALKEAVQTYFDGPIGR